MSLRSFLGEMHKKQQILEINEEISPKFEISTFMKELDGGPILYFDNVKGKEAKVVANVCGSRERLCWALDVKPENLYQRQLQAVHSPMPPKKVKSGPVNEVVERARLSKLPILTHFENDSGPCITSAMVYACRPDKKIENVSTHRLQVLDDNHLAIRLGRGHLYKLWQMAKDQKQNLDVAIALGLHPAVSLAAASPVAFGVNEFDIANALLDNKLTLIKCENVEAYAPAEAGFVLEGRILYDREVAEGPLVDITGTYDVQCKQPVVELVSTMHRRDYIYQALLPSGSEHRLLMGLPYEAMIWEALNKVVPEVKAINLTLGGCRWLHVVVSIEKIMDSDAKNALAAIFGAHPGLKQAVVVDTDIDVFNQDEVEWAIATRFQADQDLIVIKNARDSTLDFSAGTQTGWTTKLGIDATRPLSKPKEKFTLAKIPPNKRVNEIIEQLRNKMPKSEAVV